MVEVPTTGEKVRCTGCGQKFRFEVPATGDQLPGARAPGPEPSEEEELVVALQAAPSAADAGELSPLWFSLCQLIHSRYEEGHATDEDRQRFSAQADRAAALARQLLTDPGLQSASGYQVITAALPGTTLDEILRLSLEDYRHLTESLEEARELLEQHLPAAVPVIVPAAEPDRAAVAAAARTRRRTIQTIVGAASLVVVAAVVVIIALVLPDQREGDQRGLPWSEEAAELSETRGATPLPEITLPPAPGKAQPGKVQGTEPAAPSTQALSTAIPTFVPPETTVPHAAPSKAPGATELTARPEAPKRIFSRWKPGPEGWIPLFNGKDLDGWQGDADSWSVKDSVLTGAAPQAASRLVAQEAKWTDYCLALEAMLGTRGGLVIGHGDLVARISDSRARLEHAGRILDDRLKGPKRRKWYRFELDVKGHNVEVRVNGVPLLASKGYTPQRGAPAIEVHTGAVRLRGIRVRLHESDPDYRAVALGEGYLAPPTTSAPEAARTTAQLGPGAYRLFNRGDFTGWTRSGSWAIRAGNMVGRAPLSGVATVAAGSPEWRDYTFEARCRLTRASKIPRAGEYYLVIVRYRDPENFFCIRFAVEGIFEVGYYRAGRWREVSRGRRRGKFNQWHDIKVTVRGSKLSLDIDHFGDMPPWTIRGFHQGAVALGVTGGEAAFDNVRVRVVR